MSMPLAAEIESVGHVWCGRGSENSARAGRRIESTRPSMKPSHDTLDVDEATTVESMRDYYARRGTYYERVYLKPERQRDLRTMEAWLPSLFVGRRVLEVACGTGWWTPHGASFAREWLATDLNPETIEVARRKEMPSCVRFKPVDAYTFAEIGDRRFDGAFAGCWWSHVPLGRLAGWLDALHARLESGARVVMLDNSYVRSSRTPSNTPISRRDADGNTYQRRTLDA